MVASWRRFWQEKKWNWARVGKLGGMLVALLGALLLADAGGWTPVHGQESPLATPVATPAPALPPAVFAPVTLPSISGVVTDGDGAAAAGVVVTAYRRQQNTWATARQTTTNAAGEYRFPWMAAGTYRLYFRDPQGLYAATYYPDAADIEAAQDVVVLGAALTDTNLTIGAGGMISGTLAWPDGPVPFDSTIELYAVLDAPLTTQLTFNDDLSLAPELRQYRLVASQSFTESVINYQFDGLLAGRYRVCAEVISLRVTLHECFDDAALGIHATDVVVTDGGTVTDVEIEFGDGADLATLTGTLTRADATPVEGMDVEVVAEPKIDFFAAPQPQRATTDAAGQFTLDELPYGRYVVRFADADGLYLRSDYRATPTETAATIVEIGRSETVSISAVITAASLITGYVTIDNAIAGMAGQVTAFGMGTEGWFNGGTGNIVAATGAYTVTGLRAGVYRLQYSVDIPGSIYYGAPGATLETATDITVLTETVVGGINMDLTPYIAGVAFGSISGLVGVEGTPTAGMVVRIFDAAFDCCLAPPALLTTVTDAEGRYSVAGLPPGRYKVGISQPDAPAPALFAPDARSFETAAVFVLGNPADGTSRQNVTDVNINLGAVGSVARRVVRPDDTPVVGVTVNIHQRLGDPGNWPLVATTLTNENGQYTFTGLVPDIYQVCLVAEGIAEPSCSGRGGLGMGLDVVVTAGQEATGIDILDVP